MKLASVPETFPLEISYKSCSLAKKAAQELFRPGWDARLPPPGPGENSMLVFTHYLCLCPLVGPLQKLAN